MLVKNITLSLFLVVALQPPTVASDRGVQTFTRKIDGRVLRYVAQPRLVTVRFDGASTISDRRTITDRLHLMEIHSSANEYDTGLFALPDEESEGATRSALDNEPRVIGYENAWSDFERLVAFVPGVITVQFDDGVSDEEARTAIAKLQSSVSIKHYIRGYYSVLVPPRRGLFEFCEAFNSLREVVFAEPQAVVFNPYLSPTDEPLFSEQWHSENTGQVLEVGNPPGNFDIPAESSDSDIDAATAWNLSVGSSSVVIAVLDSGMDMNHEDLAANLFANPNEVAGNQVDDDSNSLVDDVNGWDFTSNDNSPDDSSGHGTRVAGLAASIGNNNKGGSGICPNCRILPVRGVSANSIAYVVDLAIANTTRRFVINISSQMIYSQAADTQLVRAYDNDVPVLAAAGNNGNILYPASHGSVIAVGGTSPCDERVSATSCDKDGSFPQATYAESPDHSALDVVAPSCFLTTTCCQDAGCSNCATGYTPNNWFGTSASTAITSGVVGLILSVNADLDREEIQTILEMTADDEVGGEEDTSGYDIYMGHGRVNAGRAVAVAVEASDPCPEQACPEVGEGDCEWGCRPSGEPEGACLDSRACRKANGSLFTCDGGSITQFTSTCSECPCCSTQPACFCPVSCDGDSITIECEEPTCTPE